jgi:hypothetical protein
VLPARVPLLGERIAVSPNHPGVSCSWVAAPAHEVDHPGTLQLDMSALPPPPLPPPPPPPAPYGAPPPVAYLKAPVGRIARRMQIFLVGIMAFSVMSIPVTLETARRAHEFIAGDASNAEERFLAATRTQGLLTTISGSLTLTVGILTMIWMFRLSRNHESIGRLGATWSSGWAIAGWFCPPILSVIPWLMLRELWKGSDPTVAPFDTNWKQAKVGPITTIWWALYALPPIVGVVLTVRKFRFGLTPLDTARLNDVPAAQTLILGVFNLAAAAAFLVLVRQLTDRHRRLIGEE